MAPTNALSSVVLADAVKSVCEYIESAVARDDLPTAPARDLHAALFILYGIEDVAAGVDEPRPRKYGTVTQMRPAKPVDSPN